MFEYFTVDLKNIFMKRTLTLYSTIELTLNGKININQIYYANSQHYQGGTDNNTGWGKVKKHGFGMLYPPDDQNDLPVRTGWYQEDKLESEWNIKSHLLLSES